MPQKINLVKLRRSSVTDIAYCIRRYEKVCESSDRYLSRWVSQMSAVEIYAVWERYAEKRLIAALNHKPTFFLGNNDIKGVSRVSAGLAAYLVRGGRQFFDFRSMSELLQTADRLVGREHNPFRSISAHQKQYVDCLAAIRNVVVHQSDAAANSYRNHLRVLYGIRFAPEAEEFLNALDERSSSPSRGRPRLYSFAKTIRQIIEAIDSTPDTSAG